MTGPSGPQLAPVAADVEAAIVVWLPTVADPPAPRVVTTLPADLDTDGVLPLVQVGDFGGNEIAPGFDMRRVDFSVYWPPDVDGNPDEPGAKRFAEKIRWLVRYRLPGRTIGNAAFTGARIPGTPGRVPHSDTSQIVKVKFTATLWVQTIY